MGKLKLKGISGSSDDTRVGSEMGPVMASVGWTRAQGALGIGKMKTGVETATSEKVDFGSTSKK